jgi:NAD(P)-dependent dehydrogenase (short-subunit alcohol dehydrogenase family)
VEFDRRHKVRGVRAAAVHPGVVKTELSRFQDPQAHDEMIEKLSAMSIAEGRGPFQYKTIPQGAATSVWAAPVASADEVGGHYCQDCSVDEVADAELSPMSPGVRSYAVDPVNAQALWAKSEETVGEHF